MTKLPIKLQKAYILVHLIDQYMDLNPSGGHLHIILEDGNYGQGFCEGCKEDAILGGDYFGELIASLLAEFTEEEQEQIIERQWEIHLQVGEMKYQNKQATA